MIAIFQGRQRVDSIAGDDRALAYGDGLFETMRAHRGTLPWWPAHWARMTRGAQRLRLPLPDPIQVRDEALALLDGGDGVLKLLLSRGSGGRGYAPPVDATPIWVLSRYLLPPPVPAAGLALRWCTTTLAIQPALAGFKHCNRLEQVLARGEWDDPLALDRDADDGLMRSGEGDVVCATSANVFAKVGGRWRTPAVDRCGVAGVCRDWVLAALDADIGRLGVAEIESATAVFLCNAVRGILPVARLGTRHWSMDAEVVALQRQLASAHPAFASAATLFT